MCVIMKECVTKCNSACVSYNCQKVGTILQEFVSIFHSLAKCAKHYTVELLIAVEL